MPRDNNGPYLRRGAKGVWHIHWTDSGRSRRRSAGTTDHGLAQKVLANFILLKDRDIANDPTPLTMAEALNFYKKEHVDAKVVSKETAELAIARLTAFFGAMRPGDIMPSHVNDYITSRRNRKRPNKDATINRDLTVLIAAISHAVVNRRLPKAEAPAIAKLPAPPPKDRWLTFAEADALIEAAGDMTRVFKFISIALHTGARRGAILELRRDQVDMARGMIRFNPAGRAQTKKRRPLVPISDELMPIMKKIVDGIDRPDALLLGAGPIRYDFEQAVKRAGLKDVTPHTLRHTWATWAAQAGVPLIEIAAVLGDTYATVERNYLHHCPEHLRGAVNAVKRRA